MYVCVCVYVHVCVDVRRRARARVCMCVYMSFVLNNEGGFLHIWPPISQELTNICLVTVQLSENRVLLESQAGHSCWFEDD